MFSGFYTFGPVKTALTMAIWCARTHRMAAISDYREQIFGMVQMYSCFGDVEPGWVDHLFRLFELICQNWGDNRD